MAEFDFSTKNGKPPFNSGGRPSKEFLQAKKALETIEALKATLGEGGTAQFLGAIANGSKKGGKANLAGDLRDLAAKPLADSFFGQIGKAGGLVATILALWKAEEKIKGMPQFLHLGHDALVMLLLLFKTLIEWFEGTIAGIKEFVEDPVGVSKEKVQEKAEEFEEKAPPVAVDAISKLGAAVLGIFG